MSFLEVDHLSVESAQGSTLIGDLSFTVDAGGRHGLIGESGSGKSVTSLAVTGLLDPGLTATGSILLDGHQVIGARDRDLRPLRGPAASIVFQEPLSALDPLMRVGRQIAEPIARHRGLRGRELAGAVRRLLDDVSLPDPALARALPHELSGGQRQRVAIAIALAAEPRLLIADEPTTALDVTVQNEILTLLDRLVDDRDMALLFISHDLAVVSRMVSDVTVLERGVAVETGSIAQIVAGARHPYTRRLVSSARMLDRALDTGAAGWERRSGDQPGPEEGDA